MAQEGIAGVRVVDLPTSTDRRGGFTEVFRQEWFPGVPPMVQCNLSRSDPGVLRGMHFHRQQADYWCVIEGRSLVALFDLRDGSPTRGVAQSIDIDASAGLRGIYVPPGVAHGFFAFVSVRLQYLVDRAFDGSDEFGFSWRDPNLPIDWPDADPLLSDRDATAPALADVWTGAPTWSPG